MRSHDPLSMSVTPLESFPPMEQWDDWVEYDAKAWAAHYGIPLREPAPFDVEADVPGFAMMGFIESWTHALRRMRPRERRSMRHHDDSCPGRRAIARKSMASGLGAPAVCELPTEADAD